MEVVEGEEKEEVRMRNMEESMRERREKEREIQKGGSKEDQEGDVCRCWRAM